MPAYESLAPVDADIDVSAGHVEVVASDRADTTVEVAPTNPGRSGDVSLAREATVAFENNRLRVRVPPRVRLLGPSGSVDVRIELPTGSRAEIESAYGSVRLRGEFGTTRIVAKYGNVSADRVGDLVLVSPHGEVDIAEVDGRLDVTAAHGHVRIGRIAGAARLRGSHGTLTLGTTEAEGGILRLENGYAEVEVGVPDGVVAWVDASSAHAAVRNELTPGPEAAGTDRTIELHLRANWGDVLIRRAARRSA